MSSSLGPSADSPAAVSYRPRDHRAYPQTEVLWSLFLMAFPETCDHGSAWFGLWRPFLQLFLSSPSLSREGEFAGWVALLQSGHLAVLHGELIDDVRSEERRVGKECRSR